MFRSLFSIFLSLLLLVAPVLGAPSGDQRAGEVQRLIPNASRNAQLLAVKDVLQWNDLLTTNTKGRLRAGLTDGSILSLGSNSELRVVRHDASTQQTLLELDYGKLRNQVVKITQPGGKYEVKTPNAVIGVIGTDFYVAYANNRTIVICYEGQIVVTPTAVAAVVGSNNPSAGTSNNKTSNAIVLVAGQMVIIGAKAGQSASEVVAAPPGVLQASMQDTEVPVQGEKSHQAKSNRRKIAVIVAVLATAGVTVALTQINSSSKPCGCK